MAQNVQETLEKLSLNAKEVTDLQKKDKKATETLAILLQLINQVGVTEADRKVGSLFLSAAQAFQKTQLSTEFYPLISDYIKSGKISAIPRQDLAFQFLKKMKKDETLDTAKFDDFIGVGIVVTLQDIEAAVDKLFEEKKN